jgi:hypothetical protein
LGNYVTFRVTAEEKVGKIDIVDTYGTFEQAEEPSYIDETIDALLEGTMPTMTDSKYGRMAVIQNQKVCKEVTSGV